MTTKPSYFNALLFFGIGFFLGLIICFLWTRLLIPEYPGVSYAPSPKELEKTVSASEKHYGRVLDSLISCTNQLKFELNDLVQAAEMSKTKVRNLQTRVTDLLTKRADPATDLNQKNDLCDSLQQLLPSLLLTSNNRDSLTGTVQTNLENQITEQDSIIAIQNYKYQDLKFSFNESLEGQRQLLRDNLQFKKTIRKQQIKSKVLSGALLIIGGAAGAYFLRH